MEYDPTRDQCKYLKLYPFKDTETKEHILVSKLFKQEIIFIVRFISQGGGEQLVVTIDITTVHTYNEHFLTLYTSNSCHNWIETELFNTDVCSAMLEWGLSHCLLF